MTRNCATKHKSGGRKGLCFVCWKVGHISNNCPEKCTDCTKKGRAPHTKDNCPNAKAVVDETVEAKPSSSVGNKLFPKARGTPAKNKKDPLGMPMNFRQSSATTSREIRKPLLRSIYSAGKGFRHGVFPRYGQRGWTHSPIDLRQPQAPWFGGYDSGYQNESNFQPQWSHEHVTFESYRNHNTQWNHHKDLRSNQKRKSHNARWNRISEENHQLRSHGNSLQRIDKAASVESRRWMASQTNGKNSWDKAGSSPIFFSMEGKRVQEIKKSTRFEG